MQLGDHAEIERLEATLLGRREVLGQGEGREVAQRRADALEPRLQVGGAR
jgi:hypothetical protein